MRARELVYATLPRMYHKNVRAEGDEGSPLPRRAVVRDPRRFSFDDLSLDPAGESNNITISTAWREYQQAWKAARQASPDEPMWMITICQHTTKTRTATNRLMLTVGALADIKPPSPPPKYCWCRSCVLRWSQARKYHQQYDHLVG